VYRNLLMEELLWQGNTGPDVLDAQIKQFKLKGLSAMRVFLRTRGIPDNMKQQGTQRMGGRGLYYFSCGNSSKYLRITTQHGLLNNVK
jgi:hypothetical protein